jgi:hypothetical protein
MLNKRGVVGEIGLPLALCLCELVTFFTRDITKTGSRIHLQCLFPSNRWKILLENVNYPHPVNFPLSFLSSHFFLLALPLSLHLHLQQFSLLFRSITHQFLGICTYNLVECLAGVAFKVIPVFLGCLFQLRLEVFRLTETIPKFFSFPL